MVAKTVVGFVDISPHFGMKFPKPQFFGCE